MEFRRPVLPKLAVAGAAACLCGHLGFVAQPLARPAPVARVTSAQPQVQSASTVPPVGRAASSQAPWLGVSAAAAGVVAVAAAAGRRRVQSITARRGLTAEDDLSLDSLMKKYEGAVASIRKLCPELADFDDVYVLRFAIEHEGVVEAAVKNVQEVMAWRASKGKKIVEAADAAVAEAVADGGWNNTPVYNAAPHQDKISKYLTSSQIVVVPLKDGDLCSCIRASAIDDSAMMDAVTVDELVEFFLYAREVNLRVANMRTKSSGRLVQLLAANDLTGVSKFPDSRFQEALTGSSKQAATLYPGLSGPTVILNLPGIVRLLVSFLTPLFPGAVQQKLKFAKGPMAYLKDLSDVTKEPTRKIFIDDITAVIKA